jgi:1-aminocyclopropane-1-carboxylate deaminase
MRAARGWHTTRVMKLDSFPRHPLLFGPSPVHPLERLTASLGGAEIWAKREDCNSGLAFGGNKTRKLEYLVAEALAQGCDTLVSIGGVQSNHTRQVAAVAARVGMQCVLVQESWVDWPDPVYDKVGNILLSRILGADIRMVVEGFGIGFKASWEQALADVRGAGGKPTPSPPVRPITRSAVSVSRAGPRRSRSRNGRWESSSTRSSSARSRGAPRRA